VCRILAVDRLVGSTLTGPTFLTRAARELFGERPTTGRSKTVDAPHLFQTQPPFIPPNQDNEVALHLFIKITETYNYPRRLQCLRLSLSCKSPLEGPVSHRARSLQPAQPTRTSRLTTNILVCWRFFLTTSEYHSSLPISTTS
jgi:hypothetical protein